MHELGYPEGPRCRNLYLSILGLIVTMIPLVVVHAYIDLWIRVTVNCVIMGVLLISLFVLLRSKNVQMTSFFMLLITSITLHGIIILNGLVLRPSTLAWVILDFWVAANLLGKRFWPIGIINLSALIIYPVLNQFGIEYSSLLGHSQMAEVMQLLMIVAICLILARQIVEHTEGSMRWGRQNLARFEALLKATPGLILVQRRSDFVFVDSHGSSPLGFPESAELIGQNSDQVLERHLASVFRLGAQKIDAHPVWIQEYSARPIDGPHYEIRSVQVDADYFVTLVQDVSFRKNNELRIAESERRWNYALNGSEDGIWEWNLDTDQLIINDLSQAILVLKPGQYRLDCFDFYDQIHPSDRGKVRESLEMYLLGALQMVRIEFRVELFGESRWVLMRGKASMFQDDGRPTAILGTFSDITDQKRTQLQLLQARQVAENAVRIQSNFLSTMSHEIRTPLNAVIGMGQLLVDENPRQDQLEKIETLQFSAQNLLALVNDVLDYSKIEAGKMELEQVSFCPSQIFEQVARSMGLKARENQVDLRVRDLLGMEIWVCGDPTRLTQILYNLLSNGIKFAPNGLVEFRCELLDSTQEIKMYFEVVDSGIGISSAQQDKIFEPFTQANSSITRNFGGTGLGLSISMRLLKLMDSELGLESELGNGARFYFTLKLPKSSPPKNEDQHTDPKADLSKLRVLLAEDNAINVKIAVKFLEKWGIAPDLAENGSKALEKATQNEYDIIFMDLHMPEMDGFESARRILVCKPRQKICALTADVLVETRQEIDRIGFVGLLHKPIHQQKLRLLLEHFAKNIEYRENEVS